MKKLSLLILFFAYGFNIIAQVANITGSVKDEENNVLVGASIVVKGTFLGTSTNSKGEFSLKNVSIKEYELVISYMGYETQIQKLNLEKETELNVKLKSTSYISDEALVTAIKANDGTPIAQTNISKQEVGKNKIAADIPYQLELTPSVVATSENGTGMGYTNMRIRGTDMTRINITVNGIPLNDSESQGVYWVNMADFTSSVSNIQIQRGVGTSTNGAASFGASVNFQTLNIEKNSYSDISSTIGSFNTFKRSISAGTGLINNKFAFDFRYSKLNSDGWIQRGFSDHESMYLSGSYYNEKNMLKAVVMTGEEHTGITWWGVPDYIIDSIRNFNPAGEYFDKEGNQHFYDGETDNYWQNHYHLLFSHEFSKNLHFNANLHATSGKGYYEQYKANDDLNSYGIAPIQFDSLNIFYSSDIIQQKWLENIFYGYTATLNYRKNNINASIGTAWNKYDGDHFGLVKWMKYNTSIPKDYEWYNNKGLKTDANGFCKIQYSLSEKISLFGDVQFRHIAYEMVGPDDDLVLLDQKHSWNFLNPKAGITYSINNKSRVFASYAIANREPARADLKEASKNGGSSCPTHETLYDIEVGYTLSSTIYAFSANLYYMNYNNQLVMTGELNNVGYPIMTNVEKSYRRGIELGFGLKPIKHFEWSGNLTLSQNKIQDYVEYAYHYDEEWNETYESKDLGETDISYSPNVIASNTISFVANENFSVNLISKYVGKQYIDNTSNDTRSLDAYFVNNIRIDYSTKIKGFSDFYAQIFVNNILNSEYISNAYGGNWYEQNNEMSWIYYYPQAGINYMLKIGFRF